MLTREVGVKRYGRIFTLHYAFLLFHLFLFCVFNCIIVLLICIILIIRETSSHLPYLLCFSSALVTNVLYILLMLLFPPTGVEAAAGKQFHSLLTEHQHLELSGT